MRNSIIALLLVVSTICFGQKFQIKAQEVRYRQNKGGYFTEWSSWEKNPLIITVNADLLKITMHSSPQQEYKIIDFKPTQKIDNSTVQDYYCIDSNGKRCTITLVLSNGGALLNLRYKSWEYIYSGYIL